jgi:hypothetical protein
MRTMSVVDRAPRQAAAFGRKRNDAEFYLVVPAARYPIPFPEWLPVSPCLFPDPKLREFERKYRTLRRFGPSDLPKEVESLDVP